MHTEIILITPQKAKAYLEKNVDNRPLRMSYVTTLANEMIAGRWRQGTGETIKFSKSDKLIDGQHRLHAVIQSGLSFRFLVAFGLDEKVIDVIDSGLKRTAGDVLSLLGSENSTLKAAIIKSFLASNPDGQGALSAGITNRRIEEFYLQDREFWDTIAKLSASWQAKFRGLSGTYFGYCFALIMKQSKYVDKAIPFFNALATGKEAPDTVIDLRNKLINNRLSVKKFTAAAKTDMIRSHWNAFIKGKKFSKKTEGWL